MGDDTSMKQIPFKSILLDYVERIKTIELIKASSSRHLETVPEYLIFKLRKYYSISDLTGSPQFKHLKVSNFYKNHKICNYCSNVYYKIDVLRNRAQNRESASKEEIDRQVEKFYSTVNANRLSVSHEQKFKEFHDKIHIFDTDVQKFIAEFTITKTEDDKYFKNQQNTKFKLPKVIRMTLQDKSKMVNIKKVFIPKQDAEKVGLKHYLGHVHNLPYSDQGLAISKSSLELNKLQDKIREIQQLKDKIETEKVRKIRKDIEMMMCTYYGKGKYEKERLLDYVEEMKKREILYDDEDDEREQQNQMIQIVTDKNDFLSENQKKQKQDKEKHDQEVLQTKKDFLELNSDLAYSVSKALEQSPLDYVSETSDIY